MKKILFIILLTLGVSGQALHAQTSYTTVVSNDTPILYWNFDEASNNAVEIMPVTLSTNARSLIPFASATRISHASLGDGLNLGNAADFLVGDYFMVQNLALPTNALRGAWMLEFWMRVQGSQEFQRNNYLMNFGAGGGNRPAVLYDYVGAAQPRSGLELYSGYGGGERTGAGPLVVDQAWHHVLFAYYGNGTNGVVDRVSVFIDGTNAAANVRANFFSASDAALNLTRFVVGTSAPQFAGFDGFTGSLDEIALYDFSKFTNELQVTTKASQVASSHFSLAHSQNSYASGVLADGPLLYWNFDESSGEAFQLAAAVAPPVINDLTPSINASRISHATSSSGLALGNAAHFPDGEFFSINQIAYPTNALVTPWIVEFWMQVEGSQATQRNEYLFNFGNNSPGIFYDYVGGAQPRQGLELYSGGRSGPGPLVTNATWHHVLFAYYGNGANGVADRLDIYLDGTNAAQNVRATYNGTLALSSLVVGTSGPGQFAAFDGFQGNLDELAIYNLANLTTEAGVTAKAADLAARHFAAAQQPSLAASLTSGQLTISWNSSATGFALESTTNLTTPVWASVNITPTVANGRSQVAVPTTNQFRFFRLRK
ncbi:MAG: LamG-like jellyroll fold domain-containing protein [Verrucomicrobiota bacterium]